jgi:hypothetical protein
MLFRKDGHRILGLGFAAPSQSALPHLLLQSWEIKAQRVINYKILTSCRIQKTTCPAIGKCSGPLAKRSRMGDASLQMLVEVKISLQIDAGLEKAKGKFRTSNAYRIEQAAASLQRYELGRFRMRSLS